MDAVNEATRNDVDVIPGTEIAGYRVIHDLGTGAASYLYVVSDPKTKQVWALKRVRKNSEKDQRFLDQAETEYEVGSRLDHVNIRKVVRLIKNRRVLRVSEVILLLELIDGISLDVQPPTSFLDATHIFQQVATGLMYMHHQGFVHADMKPNNVIVTEDRTAKIIDLGQSCRIGTVKERIQGTVDYIAPEQVHRKSISPATDVYNLGATMYWCLVGRHIPTAMSDRSALGLPKDAHLLEKPVPPIDLVPTIPPALSDLLLECVEVDPAKRPTMESVLHRLQIIHVKLDRTEGMTA